MTEEFTKLPDNLPAPHDDGEANHLLKMHIPGIVLPSTVKDSLDISKIDARYTILYFFPTMKVPGSPLPADWSNIPGARGCTPQNIAFNEHGADFQRYDAVSIGVSTQSIDELIQLSALRSFSQPLVSDSDLEFQQKLGVPTFQIEENTFYKRLTLIIQESKIIKVFYPVFPPDTHVLKILEWLENNN